MAKDLGMSAPEASWVLTHVVTRLANSIAVRRTAGALIAIACAVIIGTGAWLQSRIHVNHDVAWIAHSASWLLEGRRFGSDILDPNPPMAWFLMVPASACAKAGLATAVVCIQGWSWFLTLVGALLAAVTLRRLATVIGSAEAVAAFLALLAGSAILPLGNFGQREVIAFVLIQPYVYALVCRMGGAPYPGRLVPVLVGVIAGIGVCLKPFLLAVPAMVELVNIVTARSLRNVIRSETVTMILVVAAYGLAIIVFARDYLDGALPLIAAAYWAYEGSDYLVQTRFREAVLPAAYALGVSAATISFTRMHAVLLAVVVGFSISYWVQYKGFPYHAYPVLAASCALLAYTVLHAVRSILCIRWIKSAVIRALAIAALLVIAIPVLVRPFRDGIDWYRSADRTRGDLGRLREEPIRRLRELGVQPSDYVYALSTHPHPAFPTVSYLGVKWAGSAAAQFIVPAIARRSEVVDEQLHEAIERAAAVQVATVVADLATHRPRFVFVEARQRRLGLGYRRFDDIAYYSQNPRFAALWACYEELPPIGQIRLFRIRAGCVDP